MGLGRDCWWLVVSAVSCDLTKAGRGRGFSSAFSFSQCRPLGGFLVCPLRSMRLRMSTAAEKSTRSALGITIGDLARFSLHLARACCSVCEHRAPEAFVVGRPGLTLRRFNILGQRPGRPLPACIQWFFDGFQVRMQHEHCTCLRKPLTSYTRGLRKDPKKILHCQAKIQNPEVWYALLSQGLEESSG